MTQYGTFFVDRTIFDHGTFKDEPFSEREAWLWLISEAAFKSHQQRTGCILVSLKRGQLAHSSRFMARRWQWSEASVRRFIAKLKSDAMIDAENDAGITRVTICKYDKFQISGAVHDAANDAPNGAEMTQIRRKELPLPTVKGAEAPPNPEDNVIPLPADIRTKLFRDGLTTLRQMTGKAESASRSLIGRWLKAAKDDAKQVLRAIEDARDEQVADPVPWIERALGSPRRRQSAPSNSREFIWERH